MVLAARFGTERDVMEIAMASIPVTFLAVVARGGDGTRTVSIAGTLLGIYWLGLAFAHAVLLRRLDNGGGILIDILVGTFLGDTAAYIGGRLFGRRLLAPSISPKKTWEGLFCGMLIAILAVFIAGLQQTWLTQGDALVLGVAVAVLGPDRRPVRVAGQARRRDQGRRQRVRRPRRRPGPPGRGDLHGRRRLLRLGLAPARLTRCARSSSGSRRYVLDDVLDRLLPIVPDGVREAPAPRGQVELRMVGPHLPPLRDIARRACGRPRFRSRSGRCPTTGASAGWPTIRPTRSAADWSCARRGRPPRPTGMIDIVLEEGGAFGAGTHPTTRTCLELMLAMTPEGSFADLGCGSGVLAILAGLLGFSPLTALDVQPGSVEATRVNAARAGVEVRAAVADLSREPAPPAKSFVANVPPAVHAGIAASWRDVSEARVGLLSGFGPGDADGVVAGYADVGFSERDRHVAHGWVVSEVSRAQ